MNTKRLFLTSLLASSLVIGTAAYASSGSGKSCGGKHGGGKHAGKPTAEMMQKRLDRMAGKLDLNDAQKQQLKALFDNKQANRESKKAERDALQEQMSQLDPTADDYDQKLADFANTKSELVRQKTIAKGEMRKQMAQILTPEQQAKMKEMRKGRKGGSRHGHGKRMGKNQS